MHRFSCGCVFLCIYVSVYHVCVWCPQSPKEIIKPSEIGVKNGCELSCGSRESIWVLKATNVLSLSH